MKKLTLLHTILKATNTDKIASGFAVFVFVAALGFRIFEPSITNYGDALWYACVSFTTIGYGDFVAVTFAGRVLTVALAIYGIIVVALIPGVLVSYFTEFNRIRANESVAAFMDKLSNLDKLPKEELADIAQKIKERRFRG